MRTLVCLLALLGFAFIVSEATLPGIKSAVTQNGLTYGKDVGLLYLAQRLANIVVSLPDQSGSKDSIDFTVSDIKVQDIKIPTGDVVIQPGSGLTISTSAVAATLTANWHGREKIWPHPSGSGQATVYISQTSAKTTVQFGVANGHPTVNAVGTSASIGNLDLHFSGSHLDFLLNILKDLFKGAIKNDAENGLANTINSEIDQALNSALATMPVDLKFDTVSEIDLSLVAPEVFGANYMTLASHGEFYAQTSPSEAPYTPVAMPDYDPSASSAMGQIFISSFVIDSAGYVYYKAGALQGVLTANMVPPSSPIQFNTTSFQSIVPTLYQRYPGWAMAAKVYATQPPTVSFSAKSGVTALLYGNIEFEVISPKNGSAMPVFTLQVNASAVGTAAISGNNVTGALTNFVANFALVATEIGFFDPKPLEGLLTFIIEGVVVPALNQYLKVGFPIPTIDGLTFVNPVVSIADGYLFVATQLHYPNPPMLFVEDNQ